MNELCNLLSQHRDSFQHSFSDFPRLPHQDSPSQQSKMGVPRGCSKEGKAKHSQHPTQSLGRKSVSVCLVQTHRHLPDRPRTASMPLSIRSARNKAGEKRWSASNVFAFYFLLLDELNHQWLLAAHFAFLKRSWETERLTTGWTMNHGIPWVRAIKPKDHTRSCCRQ